MSTLVGARRLVLALVATVLVTGGVTAGAGRAAAAPAPVTRVVTTAAATTDSLQVGVSAFVMWRDWPVVDQVLDALKTSGTPWLRVDTGWCSLQEQNASTISTWYQDRLDYVVAGARARGIKLLVMVGCAPAWAGGGTTYSDYPSNPATYKTVMTYLAKRYAGKVAAWEIWNEPDCIGGCGNGKASAYVPVLKAGYQGVKAGDPSALVVTGGVSGNNTTFLKAMYAAGAQGYFDVVSTHPYTDPTTAGPTQATNAQYSIAGVANVHALMVSKGDSAKPIWFTEIGWSTGSDPAGTVGGHTGVSAAKQASYLTATLPVLQKYPYVTKAFWYDLRDRDDSSPYENGFGLFRVDGTAKPSWAAFGKVVAQLPH